MIITPDMITNLAARKFSIFTLIKMKRPDDWGRFYMIASQKTWLPQQAE
jgi:hypothetical protein